MSQDQGAVWGVIFILFLLPYCAWQMLQAAREGVDWMPSARAWAPWSVALVVLFLLYGANAPPGIGSIVAVAPYAWWGIAILWRRANRGVATRAAAWDAARREPPPR